ncbi:MAG: single-stranded DNA-binding protein [Patescibacteria group bacterium]|jgi:single-strand DNA-binding protein
MFSLNRATILGNVTRDPEVKQLPSGQSVCTFGVATNRNWTDANGVKQDKAEFHNIVAWGKLAEILGQYLAKGKKVYIEGRLQTRDWEGQDGVKRYRTEVVAENAIILDRAGSAGGGSFAPAATSLPDDPSIDPTTEIKVEDIPF